jgi:hypothetical protein
VVVGRRELSAILLAVIALVFYLVLLSTMPSSAQTGDDTTNGDNITIEDFFEEDITEDDIFEEDIRKEPTIINIPRKPLPPTGGLPVYATVAGSILAGTALLALGVGIRRGQRR